MRLANNFLVGCLALSGLTFSVDAGTQNTDDFDSPDIILTHSDYTRSVTVSVLQFSGSEQGLDFSLRAEMKGKGKLELSGVFNGRKIHILTPEALKIGNVRLGDMNFFLAGADRRSLGLGMPNDGGGVSLEECRDSSIDGVTINQLTIIIEPSGSVVAENLYLDVDCKYKELSHNFKPIS